MRNRFIVAYDVSDSKRLRRIFRKMNGFGERIAILAIRLRSFIKGTSSHGGGTD